MNFSTKFNKVAHHVDTEGFTYTNLNELYDAKKPEKTFKIDWLFVRNGKYGTHPIFIDVAGKRMVNIPSHMTAVSESILADGEAVENVKAGKVGFKIYQYTSHNRECYGVEFVDM